MIYYEKIAGYSKSELLKECKKNMEILDKMKISYKSGETLTRLKERLNVDKINFKDLSHLNGDQLYFLNIQFDLLIDKSKKEKEIEK